MLTFPTTCLAAEVFCNPNQHLELAEALERMQLAAELQAQLDFIDRPDELIGPVHLPRPIAPGAMAHPHHLHGLLSQIRADGVFVVPREGTNSLLDLAQQAFRQLHDRR